MAFACESWLCLNIGVSITGNQGREGQSPRPRRSPVLAVLGAAILFGTTGTAQALGPKDASPLSIGAVRAAVGAIGLLIGAACVSTTRRKWRPHRGALLVAGLGVAGYQIGFFEGTKRAGVALGTLVALGSGPVFAGLFHAIRVRRLPSAAWTGATLLAAAGAGFVAFARHRETGGASLVGVGAALLAGLSYALFSMASKHTMANGLGPLDSMAASFTVGALAMSPLLFTESLQWLCTPRGALVALHLGLGATTAAYALFGYGLARLAVPTVVTLTLAEPATAALLSVVVLSQTLAFVGWIGVALLIVGVGMVAAARDEPDVQPIG